MTGVLADIVRRTRERLRDEPLDVEQIRRAAYEVSRDRAPHAFSTALKRDAVNIIAEIKAASPSAGPIVDNPDIEQIAQEYKRGGAAAISIVAEPEFFRGSRQWISSASRASGLPVIMKDFVVDASQIFQAIAAGADAVLLLASLLDAKQISIFISLLDQFGCDALVEVHDEEELQRAIAGGARVIGVNNRDLRTFKVDLAISERLVERIPEGAIKVAESGIGTAADIRRLRACGFDAFLVGESLLRQNDRAAAVRRLRGESESMTKIKICGLTREHDVLFCADQGADFLGFVFVPSTPRFIEPERAAAITAQLRTRESRPKLVGVFRDASADYVREIAALVGLDLVQLHGTETDDDVRAIGIPAIKTFRVGEALPDTTAHPSAEWFLFDTFEERRSGGTGRSFDWALLAMYPRTKPFFLAGGLGPDNIAAAISLARPDAVDVSSGVEEEPGVKDHEKVESLIQRVRRP